MLRIAVCGEDPQYLEELRAMILSHPDTELVETFTDMEDLLQSARSKSGFFHAVFLAIPLLGGVNCLEYAERLYDLAPETGVIFISAPNDNQLQHILLRRIHLLGYLAKPVDRGLLSRYLDKAVGEQREDRFFSFSSHGKRYSLELGSILYFESHNHVVTVHAMEQDLSFYGKLSSLDLPEHFAQCHKSYIVNLQRVVFQGPKGLIVVSGAVVPMSRAFRESTQEAVRKYRSRTE